MALNLSNAAAFKTVPHVAVTSNHKIINTFGTRGLPDVTSADGELLVYNIKFIP